MVFSEPHPQLTGWRRSLQQLDWITLLLVPLLLAFGLIAIYSATYSSGLQHFFFRQLLYTAFGIGVALIAMWLPRPWLERLTPLAYGGSLLLLGAVLLVGRTVYGSKSWLSVAGITFQPVEIAKLSTTLALASFLSVEGRSLRQWRTVIACCGIVALPTVLVLLQPDAGSAMVFGALLLTTLLWGHAHPLVVLMPVAIGVIVLLSLVGTTGLLLGILGATVAIFLTRPRFLIALVCSLAVAAAGWGSSALYGLLKPHQKARIHSFLNPEEDPQGAGYHVIQSMLAIGSGGLTGKGFQQGTQTQLRFIPKQWTDFIFCVPAEEFGLLGAVLLLAVLFGLLWHVFSVAERLREQPFWSFVVSGIGGIWFFHTAINIGMALGLAPVIGLPLPFVSAGGSALLVNMGMVGLLMNAYRQLFRRR